MQYDICNREICSNYESKAPKNVLKYLATDIKIVKDGKAWTLLKNWM